MHMSTDINGPYLKVSLLTFHINLYLHRMMSVPPFSENGGVKNRKMDPRCSCWEEKEACLNINQAGNTRIHNQITLMATKVHSPQPSGMEHCRCKVNTAKPVTLSWLQGGIMEGRLLVRRPETTRLEGVGTNATEKLSRCSLTSQSPTKQRTLPAGDPPLPTISSLSPYI